MAKKKLNKKVALIGSMVFVILGLITIAVILYLSRDPDKFISDGDAALKLARQTTDEQIKKEEYNKAARNYHKARSLAKEDAKRTEMLFKLADLYIETNEWNNVRGCWDAIVKIDPKNIKARLGQLEYIYIMADTGVTQFWQEVASQASELIDVVEGKGLFMEDTAKWAAFSEQEKELQIGARKHIGPYLYLLRGRAALEVTVRGGVPDPNDAITRAVDDLKKVQELEPNEIDAYLYLAQASIAKGNILAAKGNLEEKDKAVEYAQDILKQAVEIASDDPRAHISLLSMKTELAQMNTKEQINVFEPEYLALVKKFNSRDEAFLTLAGFYQRLPENIDKAVDAAENALKLNEESVVNAIVAANMNYRNFSIYGKKQGLFRAMEIVKKAIILPEAQDKPGPWNYSRLRNRTVLYVFLANCYIEQLLNPVEQKAEAEKQELLTNAEQAVHEIEQLYGSGEKPEVVKWRGMLELAKGHKNIAVRKLFGAYEQLKASGREDATLSYALAKIFGNTDEIGATEEFLGSALRAGVIANNPEAILDYAEVLLKLNAGAAAVSNIDVFEEKMGVSQRSKTLRIKSYIASNQFEDAEKLLATLEQNDVNTIKLTLALTQSKIRQVRRTVSQKEVTKSMEGIGIAKGAEPETDDELMAAELSDYRLTASGLVKKMLQIDPNSIGVDDITFVFNSSTVEGKAERASEIINQFLEYFPDNTTALYYKQILSEPEPRNVSQQRHNEIQKQILSSIADPVTQHVNLGAFYQDNNEPNRAIEEYKKALGIETSQEGIIVNSVFDRGEEVTTTQHLVMFNLLGLALGAKDWKLTEQLVDIARKINLDDCEGNYHAARLAIAKEKYDDALARLNECLKQRPVFSGAYMLRSRVNFLLGNEHAYIEDAQKAAFLNRLDGNVARILAFALYYRNEKIGNNVSSDQIIETRTALERAIVLNPRDTELLSFYAEYISSTEPVRALAIRQTLQRNAPSISNAVLLGKLATSMARGEANSDRKEALFDVAASAFEQAKKIAPQDRKVLYAYAEYYRARGQDKEAVQLLQESEDRELLWYHLYQSGQFEDAKRVLDQLYQADANKIDVLKGLLLVTEGLGDKESVKKYSEELLLLEDNVENRLGQIQAFLGIDLVKEAEQKLQSLKEKYPGEPKALLFEAWVAMRQGLLKEALELTNQRLENNQNDAMAWSLRGKMNFLMSNYEQAIVDLKRSKALSDGPSAKVSLARVYMKMGQYEDAITELKGTIDSPQATMEARKLLENIYTMLDRKKELIKFYRDTIEKFPQDVYWLNRAGAVVFSEKDYGAAEQFYGQAWQKCKTARKDDLEEAFDGYMRALLANGKLDVVFEEAGKHVDGEFAAVAFVGMAEAKLKLGDRATAIQYCQKAVDKAEKSTNLEAWVLQRMYSMMGPEEVLKICREKLEANPDSFAANFTMYNLAKIGYEYNKAVSYMDRCLEIIGPDDPRKTDYILEKVQILQFAYNKTSDNSYRVKAIAEYKSLLAKMPNNPDVLNNLAYMMSESEDGLSEALEYAKRVHDIRPNDPGFLDTYAYILYKQGNYSEAGRFMLIALQGFDQYGISVPWDVYEHLGLIKEKLGDPNEAINAFKRALEVGAEELPELVRARIKTAVERVSK